MEKRNRRRKKGEAELLIKLGPKGCHCISPPAPKSLCVVWFLAISERQCLQVPVCRSQLGALAPQLLEGRQAPDVATRQQKLHVLVAVRCVGHGAAEAVAMFLSPMTALRDE